MPPHMPQTEQQLIVHAQTNNAEAFEELVRLHERSIFTYILRIVNRKEDAEDVTQETFVKFFQHLKDIVPEKGCKSWLYMTATRTAYDWLRFKRRRPEVTLFDPENETNQLESTYTSIEADITSQDLDRALDQIKPVYASVLLLYYQEGLDYDEIASALRIPLGTVKTHLHRAKTMLKKAIAI